MSDLEKSLKTKKSQKNNFEELYKRLFNKMLTLAHRVLKNKDEAFDITQDVFVKALEYQNRNPGSNLSQYILGRNLVIACSHFNKKSKYETLFK